MKRRHKNILLTLKKLKRFATTRQIADKTNLHASGVSQSLKNLQKKGYVKYLDGVAGNMRWQLLQEGADQI